MPIDNLEATIAKNGDTLALSAAMPGLVGATMRSGGILACFRDTISHQGDTTGASSAGILTVKLFNLLIKEVGPLLLRRGILVPAENIRNMFSLWTTEDWQACLGATLNQRVIGPAELPGLNMPDGDEMIHLQVDFRANF